MNRTEKYGLKKPEGADFYNVDDFNYNMDVLDANAVTAETLLLTLPETGWSNNEITVTAAGVTTSNTVVVSPAASSHDSYGSAGVFCSAQGTDSLTFTCGDTPSSDLSVNVLIIK